MSFTIKLKRGTRDDFDQHHHKFDQLVGVCFFHDTGELAYRDGLSSTGWTIVKGLKVPPRDNDPTEDGEFTVGPNTCIAGLNNKLYLFRGIQIIAIPMGQRVFSQVVLTPTDNE